jgi:hypothetical protein
MKRKLHTLEAGAVQVGDNIQLGKNVLNQYRVAGIKREAAPFSGDEYVVLTFTIGYKVKYRPTENVKVLR